MYTEKKLSPHRPAFVALLTLMWSHKKNLCIVYHGNGAGKAKKLVFGLREEFP